MMQQAKSPKTKKSKKASTTTSTSNILLLVIIILSIVLITLNIYYLHFHHPSQEQQHALPCVNTAETSSSGRTGSSSSSKSDLLSQLNGFRSRLSSLTSEVTTIHENNNNNNNNHNNKEWKVYNILDFGAIGDNKTDNTIPFRVISQLLKENNGGEMLVPSPGIFQTAPFNLSSNVVLTVHGTIYGTTNRDLFPKVDPLPSYGRDADMRGKFRKHPFIWAVHATNLTIRGNGHGVMDGGGWNWYHLFFNFSAANHVGRPHLMEWYNCTNVTMYNVTLKDSAFWTLHPVYSKNVHVHHVKIVAPSCRNYKCANTDGIDIDSCENVVVEENYIDVGDDHVTILAGKLRPLNGKIRSPPTRNITVRNNVLKKGMGLSIGSSTAGGVSDVLYQNNVMTCEKKTQLGQGIHIKVRDRYGGYIRNIAWIDNVFYVAGKPGGAIVFESDYQRGSDWKKSCNESTCTEIRDIVVRNLTVHVGNPGRIQCWKQRPCVNITFENVRYMDEKAKIKCKNVGSGRVLGTEPRELFDRESCGVLYDGAAVVETKS